MDSETSWPPRRTDLRDLLDGRGVSSLAVGFGRGEFWASEMASGAELLFRFLCELRVDRRVAVGDRDLIGEALWLTFEMAGLRGGVPLRSKGSAWRLSFAVDSRVERRLSVLVEEGCDLSSSSRFLFRKECSSTGCSSSGWALWSTTTANSRSNPSWEAICVSVSSLESMTLSPRVSDDISRGSGASSCAEQFGLFFCLLMLEPAVDLPLRGF